MPTQAIPKLMLTPKSGYCHRLQIRIKVKPHKVLSLSIKWKVRKKLFFLISE